MKIFIHTFSISVDITAEEYKKLESAYRWMPLENSYQGKRYLSKIIEFCDRGLQILVRAREEKAKRFDKKHLPYRMELVVTPYKLLNPGRHLGEIFDIIELKIAIGELDKLVDEIENTTGIQIWSKYKIQRVDITCNVKTPSETYSREIIAAVKIANLPYGYKNYEATDRELEQYEWELATGALYYNENQSIFLKVYDKKDNLKNTDEYAGFQEKGMVRYEIELTRKYLKTKKLLEKDKLLPCLTAVMKSSEEIFDEHVIEIVYSKAMLSGKLLEKYLIQKYGRKKRTLEKLLDFSCRASFCKKSMIAFNAQNCKLTDKEFKNRLEKYEDIGISPIPADECCPYIPSVEAMLNGDVEKKLLWHADRHTRGKAVWQNE